MMMNFLDLSAASEEERRLIREILSDTSVVNIAEPLNTSQQQHQHQHQQQQQQHQNQHQQVRPVVPIASNPLKSDDAPLNTSSLDGETEPNESAIKCSDEGSKTHKTASVRMDNAFNKASNPTAGPTKEQRSQEAAKRALDNNKIAAPRLAQKINSIHMKHNNSLPFLKPRGFISNKGNGLRNNNNINNMNNHISTNNEINIVTTSASGSIQTLEHHQGVNTMSSPSSSSPLNNVYNHHTAHKHQVPPVISTAKLDSKSSSSPKNQNYHRQDTSNNLQNTSAGTQSVPPSAQMPPMPGDMNTVIGMDMASQQPPSYAIPPHVTAFGPPPHHIYGGQPIFQPYHYLIHPYNIPSYMPYMLAPNSVVPPRQQVPPHSSQPPMQLDQTKSEDKQMVPPPSVRANGEDLVKHPSDKNSSSEVQTSQPQQQQPPPSSQQQQQQPIHQLSDQARVEDQQAAPSPALRSDGDDFKDPSDKGLETQSSQPLNQVDQVKDEDRQIPSSHNSANGGDFVKHSSDEGFETQSSLDVSKHSHESSIPGSSEHTTSSSNIESSKSSIEKSNRETTESGDSKEGETGPRPSAWGSASSKSWASLFKSGGGPLQNSLTNGEIDPNNSASENSDEENKTHRAASVRMDNAFKISGHAGSSKEQRSQEAAKRALDKMAPRLAQKINSIHLKHSLPFLKPRGFINKGNGCYINATLQALIACPPFYNLMKEIGVSKRENSCTPILDSFAELFLNFPPLDANKKNKQSTSQDQKLSINYLQAEAIEPKCIYNVLGQIKSECLKGAQEDAEEFLSSVLNGLHEEMIGLSEIMQDTNAHNGHPSDVEDSNDDVTNDDNLWREVGPKNRSLPIRAAKVINTPIQEIFGGSLFSIRTAGKDRCGHRSPFFSLQLDISGDNVKSVQDAIKSFTATETIHDFYCSKTKQKLDAQRRTSLDQLPPILILHLKQFVYTQDHGLKKLMKKIEYPIDFELPENCLHEKNSADKNLRTSRSYKLLAVVYHDGKEAIKGHYLTDVYHIGSSQWIRCDDNNLKVIAAPRIENPDSSRTPYLLFYRRLNTLRAQISNHDNKKKN